MPRSRPSPSEDFASLLDARARSAAAGAEAHATLPRHPHRIGAIDPIVGGALGPQAADPHNAAEARARMYMDERPLVAALAPAGCDRETVMRELRLGPELTARELERRRRDFALLNHPDRVPPWDRELATRRMTLANMLIDLALQEKRGQASG